MCTGLTVIDHPNSHQTLALANDTSLSSGKSSEHSLQKIIELTLTEFTRKTNY